MGRLEDLRSLGSRMRRVWEREGMSLGGDAQRGGHLLGNQSSV